MTLVEMKSIHNKLIFHCIQIMVSVLAELKWNCQRLMSLVLTLYVSSESGDLLAREVGGN